MARQTRLMTSLVALAATGALLAACDRRETAGVPPIGSMETNLGLQEGASPPMAYGPAANALEQGQPLRVAALGPAPERYRYIDDAYEMVDAFGDSPPDYAFDYSGVEPWVWRSDEGYYRVVEAIPGGYREYYYGPDGDAPFLVRDPRYSYAYDAGALVAVYDIYGRVQPASFVVRQADYASRYYARARSLRNAALHQERRRPYADQWRAREAALAAPRQRWAQERDRDSEWRRLREQRPTVQSAAWSQERQRREASVSRMTEQHRKPDRPMAQARDPRGPPVVRVGGDERRDQGRAGVEPRRSAPVAESRRQARNAEQVQQHAVEASAHEAARVQVQQRHAEQPEAGRQRGEIRRAREERQQVQAPQQRQDARQAERAQAQQSRHEPRQERAQHVEAPNAQAHGRPAAAQQHESARPEHGGGPKGGDKGGDKHDRR